MENKKTSQTEWFLKFGAALIILILSTRWLLHAVSEGKEPSTIDHTIVSIYIILFCYFAYRWLRE